MAAPSPLISIIIPCFNHAAYLPDAVASIWQQDYPRTEVVIVDDGSTDDTRLVAARWPAVTYVYQANQGLAAARNLGIAHSTGQYLVFLDADDWLLPGALRLNAQYLGRNPALAFVSGGHIKVFGDGMLLESESSSIETDHYVQLLQGNYIGMHATVMFQRWVFDTCAYNPQLRACEDYDLYLQVARVHPVAHHSQRIAAYRQHTTNMSGNIPLMLDTVVRVLQQQQQHLEGPAEARAYAHGQQVWQYYYGNQLYQKLRAEARLPTSPELRLLMTLPPRLAGGYLLKLGKTMGKKLLKKYTPNAARRLLHSAGIYPGYTPAIGQVQPGDFERATPFSTEFGYDRGGPVDRYYIEKFLQQQAAAIRGRVLEIGDNEYTLRFGTGVTHSDILHIDATNPKATIIGDLSDAPQLVDNTFDCIILTQTLQFIYEFRQALHTCFRILKPGGALLLTVPGLTPIDHGQWRECWYWSFTDKALQRLLAETFPTQPSHLVSYGNVFIATAFLYGMGITEVTKAQLEPYDPQFQVINAAVAIKPASLD